MQTSTRRTRATPRDPDATRSGLLRAAFQEVHRSGFQGTDLDSILRSAGVTKGALYHHFENKDALGYALVDEFLTELTRDKWLAPLVEAADPIEALARIVQSSSVKPRDIENGCPVNNLAQEMSPLDEGFRTRLARVFDGWRRGVTDALRAGQERGLVRADLDPAEAALFFIAAYEGYISLAKNAQDARVLQAGKKSLTRYLESLRPARRTRA
jgi:TetR/AcrR family transcriptional regulator, transcriptional repressor for nem operon